MTRKSRREIERAIENAREERRPDPEVTLSSDVTTVSCTLDKTERAVEDGPPKGFEYGRELPTESPVVTVRELIPAEDVEDGEGA